MARGLLPIAAAIAIAIVSASPAAAADAARPRPWEAPDRPVHWNCEPEHDEFHHIRCEEGAAPPPASTGGTAGRAEVMAFVDRHDPLLVQARESGAAAPRSWRIPLYSVPFSDRDAEQLARAVLCGRSARCTLTLGRRGVPQGLPPAPLRISATPP